MARHIFHIDLDAFFVSVEQVLNPQLKGKQAIMSVDIGLKCLKYQRWVLLKRGVFERRVKEFVSRSD
jgi:hypothetical protein